MKKLFFTLCSLFLAVSTFAQESSEKRGITAVEYDAAKKITIKNLEKESYVKGDKFVLDRIGDPFDFKFSDGTARKIYLYKLYEAAKMTELGLYIVYTTPKDGKMRAFPVPTAEAAGDVWGKYIDDLKYGEDALKGLAPCVAFVLTKSGIGGAPVVAKEGEKIEYCFPATGRVTLADGSAKAISEVLVGEKIQSYNAKTKQLETTIVEQVQVHSNQSYALTRLTLVDPATLETAQIGTAWEIATTLEATSNHPVLTATGRKAIGDVKVGETLYSFDKATQQVKAYRVFTAQAAYRQVDTVYNLVTDKDTYWVNGTVVFKK